MWRAILCFVAAAVCGLSAGLRLLHHTADPWIRLIEMVILLAAGSSMFREARWVRSRNY